METPLFSIIIPTYNSEKTLQDTLNSILVQQYKNWEIIIVDGQSKDDTLNIIKRNAADEPGIKFISEKDNGIYDAMNKGVHLSTGEWIYFLGSDDSLYAESVLSEISKVVSQSSADIVYGKVYSPKLKGFYGGEYDNETILFKNPSHQAIFYKRAVFSAIGSYNLTYPSFADWEFNIRCFEYSGFRKQYVDIAFANFAPGGTSTVRPDLHFLRNFLFTKSLSLLKSKGEKSLRSVGYYDKWWRLVRSLKLREAKEITALLNDYQIPAPIQQMIRLQTKISESTLMNGYTSKSIMFFSYIKNLFARS